MKYKLKVKANAKEEKIEFDGISYKVSIKEKPLGGKANQAIVKLFKKEFGKQIRIIKGLRSSDKIIEII